ncbi:ribonuclease H-like domain-containing protein [Tanacetum coccineum]
MAVLKDHLRRFHGMDDAKEIWAAIKTRFGGNANSKKMQKAVLKQQFEAFTISSKESLEKGYDSLAMTMRTKKNIDTLSIDDLYNNLSVFEQDIQKTSSSSLTSDNVAFLSQAKASSSKHKPSHSSGSYSSYTTSSSKATPTATPGLADEVIHSFLATNADDVDLIHEDLDQIDDLDLEEMDINWQIAMTAIKIKKFYKKTGRRPRVDGKMHVAFDKRKVECFNCHNTGHFARECKFKGSKEGSRQEAGRGQDFKPVRTEKEALMTIDEGQINWVEQTADEELNHALMAFTVNNEVSMCSKLCLDSYNALQAKYDELQSEFGDQEAALIAHKLAVKKLESQLKASHKQQSSLNEKLNFQANQIFEKDEKLKKYRRIGMKAVKDKDALQKIVDSWFASSKNLWKLIDCGMSSTVKIVLLCPETSSTVTQTCPSNDSDGEQGAVSDHSVNDDPIDPSRAQLLQTPRQPIRTPVSPSPIPSYNRQNWNQRMERELGAGYSFERKPCFVCGSLSHLIKDCDYYEKKMARVAAFKSTRVVHANVRQVTPAWTNSNRVNKANQFTPRPVQLNNIRPNFSTASRTINTGKQNVSSGSLHVSSGTHIKSGASSFNTGKQHVNSGRMYVNSGTQNKSGGSRVNTGKQNVNSGRVHVNTARVTRPVLSNQTSQVNLKSPKKCFSKQRSPVNRPFTKNTAYKSNNYAVKGKMGTAVKTSAGCVWRKTTPHSNTNSGPTPASMLLINPLKHMDQRVINVVEWGSTFGSNIATALICLSTEQEKVFDVSPFSANDFEYSNRKQTPLSSCEPDQKDIWEYEKGFSRGTKTFIAFYVACCIIQNSNAGLELLLKVNLTFPTPPTIHTSYHIHLQPIPSPTPPPIPTPTPPPIPTSTSPPPPIPSPTPPPIPTPTPPPIPTPTSPPPPPPETEPTTDEYIYEEQSPVHHHFSPSQAQAPSRMPMDDLLHTVPKLISRIDSLELDLKQTKLTMGNAIVKLVKKVKKLEGFLKRRNLVLTDSEDEEPKAQGRKSQE